MIMILFLLLGILFVIYGIFVKAGGSGTLFYLVWIILGAGSLLLALGIRMKLHLLLPRWLRLLAAGVGMVILVLFLGVEALVLSGFREQALQEPEYILVLGAQVKPSGPSVILRYRLDRALQYLQEHPDTLCIVCGGQGYNEPDSEANVMAEYLRDRGISDDRIILEDQSRNTTENVRNSMELVDLTGKRVGIVTSNFHMFRSLRLAEKQGLTDPFGIPAGSNPWFLPNNMLREFLAVIKDTLAGNMKIW
ncbi:MAG: YdcF family protein, partial [Lachnospiraceae bacterium]|nr:YdcF family protein [Lachnospiraceae bacterium]